MRFRPSPLAGSSSRCAGSTECLRTIILRGWGRVSNYSKEFFDAPMLSVVAKPRAIGLAVVLRVPPPSGTLLRFADLGGCHQSGHHVASLDRCFAPVIIQSGSRQVEPHMSCDQISRDAATPRHVEEPEPCLRGRVSLVGSSAEPLHGLYVILRHAEAVGVTDAEVELSADVPLIGGEAKPLHGFGMILRHAVPVSVYASEVVLRLSVPCRRVFPNALVHAGRTQDDQPDTDRYSSRSNGPLLGLAHPVNISPVQRTAVRRDGPIRTPSPGHRRHRRAGSVRVCSPASRLYAALRPRSAGLRPGHRLRARSSDWPLTTMPARTLPPE